MKHNNISYNKVKNVKPSLAEEQPGKERSRLEETAAEGGSSLLRGSLLHIPHFLNILIFRF